MPPTALVIGHLTLDVRPGGLVPGGTALYGGGTFAGLGARTRVVAAAGPDFPVEALRGLEAALVPAARTLRFENFEGPGGRRQRAWDPPRALAPGDVPPAWRSADALLLGPVLGEVDVPAFTASLQARAVGLAIQGLVRALGPGGEIAQPPWAFDPEALRGVDVAFAGDDDLRGQGDLAARLERAVRMVVITHGPGGAEVRAGGRVRRIGSHLARAVDPTGAGDAFAAAFVLATAGGAEPVEAARLGAAAASIAVEGEGASALDRLGEAPVRAREVTADA